MTKRLYPTDIHNQAKSVLDAWGQFDDNLTFGKLNLGTFTMAVNQGRTIDQSMTNLENQLTNMRNQRDAANAGLWDQVKRVRAGVKATFGDDSSQYEMVGGTRMSERKSAARKTPALA